jgi:hypothetical protein
VRPDPGSRVAPPSGRQRSWLTPREVPAWQPPVGDFVLGGGAGYEVHPARFSRSAVAGCRRYHLRLVGRSDHEAVGTDLLARTHYGGRMRGGALMAEELLRTYLVLLAPVLKRVDGVTNDPADVEMAEAILMAAESAERAAQMLPPPRRPSRQSYPRSTAPRSQLIVERPTVR